MDRIKGLLKKGETYFKKGEFGRASMTFSEAISILGTKECDDDDQRLLSEILRLLAFSDCRKGDYAIATVSARKSMDISSAIGDKYGEADALRRLGYIHWQKADHAMALEFYDAALQKANECKATDLVGKITVEMANTYNHMMDVPKAEEHYRAAAAIFKRTKDTEELTRVYNNLGAMYLNSHQHKAAITVLKQCVRMADKTKDPTLKAWSRFNLAEGLIMIGKVHEALGHLKTAYDIIRKGDDLVALAAIHLFYGQAYIKLKEWSKARSHIQNALELEQRIGIPKTEGETLVEMGKMYLAKDDKEKARAYLDLAYKVYEKADMKKQAAEVREMMAKF